MVPARNGKRFRNCSARLGQPAWCTTASVSVNRTSTDAGFQLVTCTTLGTNGELLFEHEPVVPALVDSWPRGLTGGAGPAVREEGRKILDVSSCFRPAPALLGSAWIGLRTGAVGQSPPNLGGPDTRRAAANLRESIPEPLLERGPSCFTIDRRAAPWWWTRRHPRGSARGSPSWCFAPQTGAKVPDSTGRGSEAARGPPPKNLPGPGHGRPLEPGEVLVRAGRRGQAGRTARPGSAAIAPGAAGAAWERALCANRRDLPPTQSLEGPDRESDP